MNIKTILLVLWIIGLAAAGCSAAAVPETANPAAEAETGLEAESESDQAAGDAMAVDSQFEEAVANYNVIYKKALFSTGQAKEVEAQKTTPQSLQVWQEIAANYGQSPPAGYGQTEDWSQTIAEISTLEQEAADLVEQGDYQTAHEQLEQVRKILRAVRLENDITNNISDLMLTFHDEMEIVAQAATLEEAEPHIANLVAYFEPIQAYSDDPDFQAQAQKLGQIVTQLQNVETEEAFKEAQSKIKPAFIQFYLQHG